MRPRKLLLVDDEPYITATISTKLRDQGDEVVIATDGLEAMELLKDFTPDLIVTDFQMPMLSGFELACQLKQHDTHSKIPVIMLTARGHALTKEQLAQTSVQVLLAKPFSARILLTKIDEMIGPPRAVATLPQIGGREAR